MEAASGMSFRDRATGGFGRTSSARAEVPADGRRVASPTLSLELVLTQRDRQSRRCRSTCQVVRSARERRRRRASARRPRRV